MHHSPAGEGGRLTLTMGSVVGSLVQRCQDSRGKKKKKKKKKKIPEQSEGYMKIRGREAVHLFL